MTGVLRGVAGELSDLVEGNHPKGSLPALRLDSEGTPGRTSRPQSAPEVKREAEEESDYTEESAEEETVIESDKAVEEVPPAGEAAPDRAGSEVRHTDAPVEPEPRTEREEGSVPEKEAQELGLQPAPKATTRGRRRESEGSTARPAKRRGGDRKADHSWTRTPRREGGGHDEEEDSWGRAPLVRRPSKRTQPRDRGTKGARHRERAREFKKKKIEERRKKKAEKQWHQKQKQAKAGVALRRPAARGRGGGMGAGAPAPHPAVLRRPATRRTGRTQWEEGRVVDLHLVPLEQLSPGLSLVVVEGDYFGAMVQIAGKIRRVEALSEGVYVYLQLTGTTDEHVLRAFSGNREQLFRLHVCPPGCSRQESGDYYLHALKGRLAREADEEAWVTGLQDAGAPGGEDELEQLRKRGEALGAGGPPDPPRKRSRSPDRRSPREEKKKKKRKKDKDKTEELVSGRHAAKAGTKELKELFAGTGLDPKEKVRRRVVKRAQKYIARRKSKQSSSSSSASRSKSTSSSSEEETTMTEGVQRKPKRVPWGNASRGPWRWKLSRACVGACSRRRGKKESYRGPDRWPFCITGMLSPGRQREPKGGSS